MKRPYWDGPAYRYPFMVNGVPSTVKYLESVMESMYKRKKEDEKYRDTPVQEQLTESR